MTVETPSSAVTQAEFARLLGRDKAHVTRLKQAGRLVMDGKLVRVEESRSRIAATGGQRPDVAERHAVARGATDWAAAGAGLAARAEAQQAIEEARTVGDWRDLRVKSEARRMQAQADREEMERDRLAGDLIDREDAARAMRDIGAAVRAAMENYADQVAPGGIQLSEKELSLLRTLRNQAVMAFRQNTG